MRVIQGIVLGAVLSVPVVLWGLTRVDSALPGAETESQSQTASQPRQGAAKSRRAKTAATRRHARPKTPDADTIPASQMHVRVDDGSRAANPPSGPNPGKGDVD